MAKPKERKWPHIAKVRTIAVPSLGQLECAEGACISCRRMPDICAGSDCVYAEASGKFSGKVVQPKARRSRHSSSWLGPDPDSHAAEGFEY